jgi:hypothetical protein
MPLSEPTPAVVYERHPGAAASPLPPTYRPRRPEQQPLYRIVADHVETFLSEPLAHGAAPYPRHVEHEFRRFLTCGIPAHGFYRVRCPDCGHERLLGLSCAGRLCPSCWGRRMADGAAHLVDRVLPPVPFRQVVLSVPYRLRFHLARDGRFLSQMLTAHLQSVFAWQRSRGRAAGIDDGHTGAVTFVQRFGGALNLNVHFHTITPDGLFVAPAGDGPDATLRFVPLPPPTDAQVAHLTRRVARRLQKRARRYLEGHQDAHALVDPDDEEATLQHALSTALRPPVRPQRALLPGLDDDPEPPPASPLCARVAGYSLHAARVVAAHDRPGLERLCRYGLRAPFSQRRLAYLPDGRVHYRLDKPWPTPAGVTDLVMEPVQFLKRLAALLPPPYQNQLRYHGCFANRSRFRRRLPPPPPAADDDSTPQLYAPHTDDDPEPEPETTLALVDPTETRPRRLPWARLLKRTLGVDGLDCPRCHAQMLVIALITKADVVQKILDHLRLPATPPPVAPPRQHPADAQADLLDFNQDQTPEPHRAASPGSSQSARAARAPPRA